MMDFRHAIATVPFVVRWYQATPAPLRDPSVRPPHRTRPLLPQDDNKRRMLISCCLLLLLLLCLPGPYPTAAAITATPTLNSPIDGETVTTFGPTLTWANAPGVTHYHLQLTPAGNDGPGLDLLSGSVNRNALETVFNVPAPPRWYGLLPDMTYTWRVRVSDAPEPVSLTDSSWSPWAERRFRTPTAGSEGLEALTPGTGETVTTLTPTVQWGHNQRDLYYYEVQLSRDPTFNTNPAIATAGVHSLLIHGRTTTPANSYTVPPASRLDDNATYHWRVRPRVQGDGTPVAWSIHFSFSTRSTGRAALRVDSLTLGVNAPDDLCQVQPIAITLKSKPTLTGVHTAIKYGGAGNLVRNLYFNERPLLPIAPDILPAGTCFKSKLEEPGGGPDAGSPLPPGAYRLEVWHAGQKAASAEFSVAPADVFEIGPVTVGTGQASPSTCTLSGVGTVFPPATRAVWFRFNYVGTGIFSAEIIRGFTRVARTGFVVFPANATVGCFDGIPYRPPRGFVPGDYRVRILVDGSPVQTATFTIR